MTNYPRYKKDLQAYLSIPDGRTLIGSTVNLSTEGANLIFGERLSKGLHCVLELKLKTEPNELSFKLRADTIYCSQLSEVPGYGIGLKFTEPPEHYLSLIDHLEKTDP